MILCLFLAHNTLYLSPLTAKSISHALLPSTANMSERQTWWECFTGCSPHWWPIKGTPHDRQCRLILLLLISTPAQIKKSGSACHINNSSFKIKFFSLKCECGQEIGKKDSEKDIKNDSRLKQYKQYKYVRNRYSCVLWMCKFIWYFRVSKKILAYTLP